MQRRLKACSPVAAQADADNSGSNSGGAAGNIGPGTAGGSLRRAEQWERRRQEVKAFQQQHDRIPRVNGGKGELLTDEERQLGEWCVKQRQRKRDTRGLPLTAEQEAALEAIPGWFWDGEEVSQLL